MDILNAIADVTSIVSLLLALLTFTKVTKIENQIISKDLVKSKQVMKDNKISESTVYQSGRDTLTNTKREK